MAVFPDRIVLKNSTDGQAAISQAIGYEGTDEIQPGELVIGQEAGYVDIYSLDSKGNVVKVGSNETTALNGLIDVTVGQTWFSGFETGDPLPLLGSSTVTTEQAYSGTQSLKATTSGLTATFENVFPQRGARYDFWSFRFRPASTPSTSFRIPLGGNQSAGTTTGAGYSLYISGTNCVFSANGATQNLSTSIPAFTANTWYHFAVQLDWSTTGRRFNPRISVWIDGALRVNNVQTSAAYSPAGISHLSFNTGSSSSYTKYFDDIQIGQGLTSPITSMTSSMTPATFDAAVRALGPAVGSSIVFNGGQWVAGAGGGGASALDDLTDVSLTSPANGNVLSYNGTQWVNTAAPPADISSSSIDQLNDVDTVSSAPTNGQALVWNGSNWVPGTVSTSSNLDGLTDVAITSAATGEVLRYNGTAWVDAQLAYTDLSGTPTLATVATTGAYADLTGKPTIPASIDDLSDVDTVTTAPATDQVLVWNGSNWVPGDQTGGGGGSVQTAFVTESQTASGGAATFVGVGKSGQLVQVTSSLDAWVVLYPTAAARTADAGRSFGTDPAPGSGVLAEFYITSGSTVLATPGTTYFNNDTTKANAIYAAVRDQAGANVNSQVTLECYAADDTIGYRTTLVATTASLANDAAGDLTFTETGKSGRFISIATDKAAWVTLYTSTAARTADSGRSIGTDPATGSGVLAEVITTGSQTIKITPSTGYFNDEATPVSEVYAKVVNKSGSTNTIAVSITVVPAEA